MIKPISELLFISAIVVFVIACASPVVLGLVAFGSYIGGIDSRQRAGILNTAVTGNKYAVVDRLIYC